MSTRKQRERLALKRAAYEAELAKAKKSRKGRRKTPQTKKKPQDDREE